VRNTSPKPFNDMQRAYLQRYLNDREKIVLRPSSHDLKNPTPITRLRFGRNADEDDMRDGEIPRFGRFG